VPPNRGRFFFALRRWFAAVRFADPGYREGEWTLRSDVNLHLRARHRADAEDLQGAPGGGLLALLDRASLPGGDLLPVDGDGAGEARAVGGAVLGLDPGLEQFILPVQVG
jgi:hypothetical protein